MSSVAPDDQSLDKDTTVLQTEREIFELNQETDKFRDFVQRILLDSDFFYKEEVEYQDENSDDAVFPAFVIFCKQDATMFQDWLLLYLENELGTDRQSSEEAVFKCVETLLSHSLSVNQEQARLRPNDPLLKQNYGTHPYPWIAVRTELDEQLFSVLFESQQRKNTATNNNGLAHIQWDEAHMFTMTDEILKRYSSAPVYAVFHVNQCECFEEEFRPYFNLVMGTPKSRCCVLV